MRLLSLVFAILLFLPVDAQKKEISQARSYIKSRSNLDKAETSMRDLLKDSVNGRNLKIHLTLFEAVKAQYEVINEKLYLKQSFDTVTFFNTVKKMFMAGEGLDSVEMYPDKNGKVKLKYREKNAEYLSKYRRNLYNGGVYFMRKKNYDASFGMMDTYIDTENQPLFSSYAANKDSLLTSAAFWTVFCGYKLGNADYTLKHSDLALTDRKHRQRTFVYMASAYLLKGDTVSYVKTLRRGFEENKRSEFFFTRLMDYYNGTHQLDTAMSIVDSALESDGNNALFLFAKSNMLLNMGKYAECITISDTLLARNDTLTDVYLNAGISYINLALALENDVKEKKRNKEKILGYYRKALPYMEKYRTLAPDEKERWAPSLYNIYLKLNMGRKFEEISEILRNMRE